MHDEHPPRDSPPHSVPGAQDSASSDVHNAAARAEIYRGESGLVVLCDSLDHAVMPVRARYDEGYLYNVPSHVTLLFPWVSPPALTLPEVHRVRELLASFDAFDAQLTSIGRFGDQVIFLKPEPRDAWNDLIEVLTSAYPQYPPYDGAYETVVPHLTLAHNRDFQGIDTALAELEEQLPLDFRVDEVSLLVDTGGPQGWSTATRFQLRDTSRPPA